MSNEQASKKIFHIAERSHWVEAKTFGDYRPPSLKTEGFIHASTQEQVLDSADRYYSGRNDLLLLEIDPSALKVEVKFEDSHGDLFPHVYGPIDVDAVTSVKPLALDAEGGFKDPWSSDSE